MEDRGLFVYTASGAGGGFAVFVTVVEIGTGLHNQIIGMRSMSMTQSDQSATAAQPKRLGDLFVESGLLAPEDLNKALEYGKKTALPLGRVLIMLRLTSDAHLRAVLHVQQLMKFEGMPGSLAVRALTFMHEKSVHIEWAVRELGWRSEQFKQDIPKPLREAKEKLAEAESRLGHDHPDLAPIMMELVDFYLDEKMWPHAEATCYQALEKCEKAFGTTDLKLVPLIIKLSDVLFMQDRFQEALSQSQRAVELAQAKVSDSDPLLARALRNLAELYDVTHKFSDAERAYARALKILSVVHDPDDAAISYLVRHAGYVWRRAGRQVTPVLIGDLMSESGLVPPDKVPEALAYSKQNGVPMARAFVMMDLLSEDRLRPVLHAQLLIKTSLISHTVALAALRICSIRKIELEEALELLGVNPQIGRRQELGSLLQTNDQLLEAERTHAPDDPEIGSLCLRMADLYDTYERYADSEPLYKRALSILEKHNDTIDVITEVLDRLAGVYVKQMKYEQAEAIYRRVLELRIESLGSDHADVAASYTNLGRLQIARGNHEDGCLWLQKALPLAENHLGASHAAVGDIVEQLAFSYYESGRHDRAEPMFWQAYRIKSEYMDVASFEIVSLLTKLAEMYNKDGKYSMADSVIVLFQQNKSVML